MGFLVYLYSGRCVRHERKGRRRAKPTRCCSKAPLLIEREKRRGRDNGEKRKMKTRRNELVQKEVIPLRERERESRRGMENEKEEMK